MIKSHLSLISDQDKAPEVLWLPRQAVLIGGHMGRKLLFVCYPRFSILIQLPSDGIYWNFQGGSFSI